MYRIHDLHRVLLVPYIDLSPLTCLFPSLGHLFINPVRLRFLPLLLYLITNSHKLVIVSQLCLEVDVTHVLIELFRFLGFMLFQG
jgi:hypothetical protein